MALAERYSADAVHPALNGVTSPCHDRGLLINVWTVDAPEAIERAIALKVDGIISNVPDRVLRALGRDVK